MTDFAADLIERLAWSIPYLVLVGIALGICAKNKSKNPEFARLVSWAFFLIGAHSLVSILNRVWFASRSSNIEISSIRSIGLIYASVSALTVIMSLAGWGLIVLAVHRVFKSLPCAPGV